MRLHAAERFDDTIGPLLERCEPGTPLASRPETDQDQILAGLMLRLWKEPSPDAVVRPHSEMSDQWADESTSHSMVHQLAEVAERIAPS